MSEELHAHRYMDAEYCWYCGAPDSYYIEHCTPRIQGGTDAHANLVSACQRCNNLKSGCTVEQFRVVWEHRYARWVREEGERVAQSWLTIPSGGVRPAPAFIGDRIVFAGERDPAFILPEPDPARLTP
jgi:hypothetical protein